ncbi:hypothetical protein Clacol_008820 [Clathrus columnatus]|uniref:FAD-binding PCMH-type domain-containing protein n=1 Tax=Clathrus columnatus TaxID=1419009 RepID=A0AAV5ANZ0_9AGAM|nr:hypothetical protein Clacol_008820 [Clathrus columnatus]
MRYSVSASAFILTLTSFSSTFAIKPLNNAEESIFITPIHQIPLVGPIAEPPAISQVSPAQWISLNSSVSGRLHRNIPFARECFKKFNGDEEGVVNHLSCQLVQQRYLNESLRTSHPAAYINTQWETCQSKSQGCLLDCKNPTNKQATEGACEMGSLSSYYIDVHTAEDVKAAFVFSRTTSVPLVIKNTGHDYKGRSTAPNSLQLWTHKLQHMEYHEKFSPSCPEMSGPSQFVQAVTLGAGVQWYQAYAFAEEHNITLVGGADKAVGAVGGWLQGGGHGALSNTMGLGVDRVLEFQVVTPDGELRIANICQNKDLFFALRGGGGGTFGVVLSATILASPPINIQATLIQFPMGLTPPAQFSQTQRVIDAEGEDLSLTQSMWSLLLNNSLRWAQEGWGGYVNGNSALYINPVLNQEDAKESMKPLVNWAARLRDSVPKEAQGDVLIIQGEFGTWGNFFNLFANDNSADLGEPLAIASRLIPTSSVSSPEARDTLLKALMSAERIAPGLRFLITTPFNHPLKGNEGELSSPSAHPAWRHSIFHVTTVTTWNWNATQSDIAAKYKTASDAILELDFLSNAAYVNEADVYEVNWQDTYWGKNYPTLLKIKQKYDPDQLLDCWHCDFSPNHSVISKLVIRKQGRLGVRAHIGVRQSGSKRSGGPGCETISQRESELCINPAL